MNKKTRPFDSFLNEISKYLELLRYEYMLKDNRGEAYSVAFYLGQLDAIEYMLRVGSNIFKSNLKIEAPAVRILSDDECIAIAKELESSFKSHNKKGG